MLLTIFLLAGCGDDQTTGQQPEINRSVSTTLECENNLRNVGAPDYAVGEPNTEEPVDQAMQYVEGTHMARDYSEVEVVVAEAQSTSQVIALVGDGKTVGILGYGTSPQLGWHLESLEECSPSR